MTANQWRRVEEIFLAALEKPGTDRARYLKEACLGNTRIRREVESLLSHEEGGERILQRAVSDAARNLSAKPDKYTGSKIGHYYVTWIMRTIARGRRLMA